MKIIIRMPNWIGDITMATPILEAIKKNVENAYVAVVIRKNFIELLKDHPFVDEIIPIEREKNKIHYFFKCNNFIKKIKTFDLAILLTNSLSSSYPFWKSHIKTIGYSKFFRRFFLKEFLQYPKREEHLVFTYLKLLKLLKFFNLKNFTFIQQNSFFANSLNHNILLPKLCVSEEEVFNVKNKFFHDIEREKKIIVLHPGASYGMAKRWPEIYWQEFIKDLIDKLDVYVVLIGDKKTSVSPFLEEKFNEKVSLKEHGSVNERVNKEHENIHYNREKISFFDLTGKTSIREMMAILKMSDLLVTNDSGPMHVAAALDRAVVALFGSTSFEKTGPLSNSGKSVVITKNVCRPCFKRKCKKLTCMKNILPKEVFEETVKIIGNR